MDQEFSRAHHALSIKRKFGLPKNRPGLGNTFRTHRNVVSASAAGRARRGAPAAAAAARPGPGPQGRGV